VRLNDEGAENFNVRPLRPAGPSAVRLNDEGAENFKEEEQRSSDEVGIGSGA
jgi:hypothetical protein